MWLLEGLTLLVYSQSWVSVEECVMILKEEMPNGAKLHQGPHSGALYLLLSGSGCYSLYILWIFIMQPFIALWLPRPRRSVQL